MFEKLDKLVQRYNELNTLIGQARNRRQARGMAQIGNRAFRAFADYEAYNQYLDMERECKSFLRL